MTLADKLAQLVSDFAPIDDPHERLALAVNRARRLPPLTENERIDAHRVPGCISAVWLVGELRDGYCYFRCDADGPLVKGLVALLCDFFSGATAAEIVASQADPVEALDLAENLSPTRRHGLASARTTIIAFAQKSIRPAG